MSFARAVPVALLLALAAPAVAHAGTLSIAGTEPSLTLTLDAQDGLDHTASAQVSGDTHRDLIVQDDTGIDVAGTGCTLVGPGTADCGPVEHYVGLVVLLGSGDDVFTVPWGDVYLLSFPISVDGGDGDDFLQGSNGLDELRGGAGDDVLDAIDPLTGRADPLLSCGEGIDAIRFDHGIDRPSADCEILGAPEFDGAPVITGDPRVGSALGLSLPIDVGGDGAATIQWARCDASGYECTDIGGANASTYTPTAADVGLRLRTWYVIENVLGDDWAESQPTSVVRAVPAPRPPTPRPPRPRPTPRPPTSHVDPLKLTIAPFVVARKPSFAVRNGRPVVDTGRTMLCPGVAGGLPCHLHLSARPAGPSAHWRGRPTVAGELGVDVAAGAGARVRFQLGRRAYGLLLAHRKLTLSIAATITRSHSAPVKTTFVIAVKPPPSKRR